MVLDNVMVLLLLLFLFLLSVITLIKYLEPQMSLFVVKIQIGTHRLTTKGWYRAARAAEKA